MEKLIVANHKMNMSFDEVKEYVSRIYDISGLVVCPSSLYVSYFISNGITTGVQNIYDEESGAYTGEISALQARSLGALYVIVGHSERRRIFGENDYVINKKIKIALKNGLIPILCVGEDNLDDYKACLKKQLEDGLDGVSSSSVIIAYEPVCFIGTGKALDRNIIKDRVDYIRSLKPGFKIFYGGSVNEKNIDMINDIEGVSGYLVGSASTDVDNLLKIREVVR